MSYEEASLNEDNYIGDFDDGSSQSDEVNQINCDMVQGLMPVNPIIDLWDECVVTVSEELLDSVDKGSCGSRSDPLELPVPVSNLPPNEDSQSSVVSVTEKSCCNCRMNEDAKSVVCDSNSCTYKSVGTSAYAHAASLFTRTGCDRFPENKDKDVKDKAGSHSRSHTCRSLIKSTSGDVCCDSSSSGAFCNCYKGCHRKSKSQPCSCGEEDEDFDWVWDENAKSWACYLQREQREVRFHKHYSSGTATVRGNTPLSQGQHYWEIKMISPVYGTDMMVGVGTADADLNRNSTTFCSFLGSDSETWGLSYTGIFHHDGKSKFFSSRFGQGTIIGVHLDTWKGTLSFYRNRKLLGVACDGLKGKVLYPMVSSTAARSGMRMVRSCSFQSSLKFFSCMAIRNSIPRQHSVLDSLLHVLPPGLAVHLENQLSWLLGSPKLNKKTCHGCWKKGCQGNCLGSRRTELFLENQLLSDEFSDIGSTEGSTESNFDLGLPMTSNGSRKQPIDDSDTSYGFAKRRCFQMLKTSIDVFPDSSNSEESDSDIL